MWLAENANPLLTYSLAIDLTSKDDATLSILALTIPFGDD
jgi:hypothetical protein